MDSYLSQGYYCYVKWYQSRPGFELVSLCPFPTTITITPRAPPINTLWKILLIPTINTLRKFLLISTINTLRKIHLISTINTLRKILLMPTINTLRKILLIPTAFGSTRMTLALNNPRRFICHYNNETKPKQTYATYSGEAPVTTRSTLNRSGSNNQGPI